MNHIKTVNAEDFRRLLELGFHAEIVKSKRPFAVGDLYHHQEVIDLTAAGNFTGSEFTAKIETVQSGKHLNKNCYQLVWRIIDTSGVKSAAAGAAVPVRLAGVEALNAQVQGYGEPAPVITEVIPEGPNDQGAASLSSSATELSSLPAGHGDGTGSDLAQNTASSTGSSGQSTSRRRRGNTVSESAPADNTGAAVVTEPGTNSDDDTTPINDLF